MDNPTFIELIKTELGWQDQERIFSAMKKVDRKDFLPNLEITTETPEIEFINPKLLANIDSYSISVKELAYNNNILPIGLEQTCSQPSLIALMTKALELQEGMKVLEIGTGCGYHAAITAELLGEKGKLVTMEYLPELKTLGENNLRQHFPDFEQRIRVIEGDGSLGFPEEAPFDRIYFTAGVNIFSFNPRILTQQLKKEGGIFLYPEHHGYLRKRIYQEDSLLEEQKLKSVHFVPLQGKNS